LSMYSEFPGSAPNQPVGVIAAVSIACMRPLYSDARLSQGPCRITTARKNENTKGSRESP